MAERRLGVLCMGLVVVGVCAKERSESWGEDSAPANRLDTLRSAPASSDSSFTADSTSASTSANEAEEEEEEEVLKADADGSEAAEGREVVVGGGGLERLGTERLRAVVVVAAEGRGGVERSTALCSGRAGRE